MDETSQYKVHLLAETALAILIETEFGEEVWLPKKLIEEFVDNKDGTCSFECSDKIAEDKGLV